jgi:hypothetical protein
MAMANEVTYARRSQVIRARIEEVRAEMAAERAAYNAARSDWMQDNGYCLRCGGKGCYRFRPTLDYMNEFETADCPDCGGTGRAGGVTPDGSPAPRRKQEVSAYRNGSSILPAETAPAYAEVVAGFRPHDRLTELEQLVDELLQREREAKAVEENPRGRRVVVARGRKVPVGTTGVCFWAGESRYGDGRRVGIRGDDGKEHWTDLKNVEVLWDDPA